MNDDSVSTTQENHAKVLRKQKCPWFLLLRIALNITISRNFSTPIFEGCLEQNHHFQTLRYSPGTTRKSKPPQGQGLSIRLVIWLDLIYLSIDSLFPSPNHIIGYVDPVFELLWGSIGNARQFTTPHPPARLSPNRSFLVELVFQLLWASIVSSPQRMMMKYV